MRYLSFSNLPAVRLILTLCVLTLLLTGCGSLGERTNALPPAPRTLGAIVTDQYICIPHDEAADLLLWIETVEERQ